MPGEAGLERLDVEERRLRRGVLHGVTEIRRRHRDAGGGADAEHHLAANPFEDAGWSLLDGQVDLRLDRLARPAVAGIGDPADDPPGALAAGVEVTDCELDGLPDERPVRPRP